MTNTRLFVVVGVAAMLAGAALWQLGRPVQRPAVTQAPVAAIAPAALFAATFTDAAGDSRSLGQFQGKVLVLLSDESTDKAQQFGRALGISYPLWTGGDQVAGLSRRLGNALGGLPHTVVLDRRGEVTLQTVGPYTEVELEKILQDLAEKGR